MKEPILERNNINANIVESVSVPNGICRDMEEPTLEKSLLNANGVESVLPKQET